MRLLVVTAAYPGPTEPERAGYLESLHASLLAVAEGALEIHVLAPRVHPSDPIDEVRQGVSIERFGYLAGGRRLRQFPRLPVARLALYLASGRRLARRAARRWSPDVVLGHWVLPSGLITRAVGGRPRPPSVLWAHGSDVHRYARRGAGRKLARLAARGASRVLAVSGPLADALVNGLGVDPGRVHVLPMGVAPCFTPGDRGAARRRLGLGEGCHLLVVGDVVREKGIRELVTAVGRLRADGAPVRLHVIGDGPLRESLAAGTLPGGGQAIAGCGEAIHCLGRLPSDTLATWYRGADLLVHPSWAEGTPVVVMEALACGLPVVASAVGGIPDLLRGDARSTLVPPRDPDALTAALRRFLEEHDAAHLPGGTLPGEATTAFSVRARATSLWQHLREVAGDA